MALSIDEARALLRQGRLHELVGSSLDASPDDLRAACKKAQLQVHPDKGGDPELFRLVREAVERLLPVGLPSTFDGPTPAWAQNLLCGIQSMRRTLELWQSRLREERSSLKRCHTKREQSKARNFIADSESQISGLLSMIASEGQAYLRSYREHHDQLEEHRREQRERFDAHMQKERAECMKLLREGSMLRLRALRETGQFPTLPSTTRDPPTRATFQDMRVKYRRLVDRHRKRVQRGHTDGSDNLSEEIRTLLASAREFVKRERDRAAAENYASRECFPHVASSDPRASAMAELKKTRRSLLKISQRKCDADISNKIRENLDQARQLLINGEI